MTYDNTWVFASDAEGLTDQALSTAIAFAHDAGAGSPSAGCVGFTTTTDNLSGEVEKARRGSTGQTFESVFGVPSGYTCTHADIPAFEKKRLTDLNSSGTVKIRLVNSSGNTIHSAGELVTDSIGTGTADISWVSDAGSQRAIDSSYQASNTDIRLELEATFSTGASSSNISALYDSIRVAITAVAPTGEYVVATVLMRPMVRRVEEDSRRSSAQVLPVSVMAEGRLYYSEVPDMRGQSWREAVIVAESTDQGSGAILFTGSLHVAIYSTSDIVYVKRTGNPANWAAAEIINTSMVGRVYGAAMNDAGVICALIGNDWWLSRDLGETWTEGGTGGWPLPATIAAVRHMFVVQGPTGATPKHWISQDGGSTFA